MTSRNSAICSSNACVLLATQGSEEYLTANANALDILEEVASFVNVSTSAAGERNPTLEKLHSIRDKHTFRILASVASSTHSTKSRLRAVEEPMKRLKDHGDLVLKFVRVLVRKCAMGDFINQEIVHHCILLAHQCGSQDDWESCRKFLDCVQLAVEHFPDICADGKSMKTLTELFARCRSSKGNDLNDIVTSLSAILANAASSKMSQEFTLESNLHQDLLRLCRDGSPEQARHAVRTMTGMIFSRSDSSGSLGSLLNSLASPSLLSSSASNERIVSSLAALSEFAEVAPRTIISQRGQKAVSFALESVLLGRENPGSDDESSDRNSDDVQTSGKTSLNEASATSQRRRNAKKRNMNPSGKQDLLDDKNLTMTCRKLCGAIEFLTAYIRAACFEVNQELSQNGTISTSRPSGVIERLFETLSKILRDEGTPPSKRDRQNCIMRRDRAALRQCVAISLLRLCDPRLGLDSEYLITSRWHLLASVFLDDERSVREAVIAELGLMLTGHGKYGTSSGFGMAMPPRPKFFALVVLCPDGENSSSNGNAANVGRLASHAKMNAFSCVNSMRAQFVVEAEQARANGPAAEQQFERGGMKFNLMPEYVVPYAFHLLAFRKETPMGTLPPDVAAKRDDTLVAASNEVRHRLLRKRLKWLFDPLVLSLGDTADNISFLISMSTKLSRFAPVGLSPTELFDVKASARLQAVCEVSRSVLMTSYVKKDINLAPFPGQIMIPTMLYKISPAAISTRRLVQASPSQSTRQVRRPSRKSPVPQEHAGNSTTVLQDAIDGSISKRQTTSDSFMDVNSGKKRYRQSSSRSPLVNTDRISVQFSPEVSFLEIQGVASFGELSPVERRLSTTEISGDLLDSGEKTRGSTPPSAVRDLTFGETTSTQNVPLSASVTQSPSWRTSDDKKVGQSTRRSSRLSSLQKHSSASSILSSEPVATAQPQVEGAKKTITKLTHNRSLPEQIKILRPLSLHDSALAERQSRKRTNPKNDDDLNFSGSEKHDNEVSQETKNEENSSQPRGRAPRRRIKI